MEKIRIKKGKWFKKSHCKSCKKPLTEKEYKKNKYVCPLCGDDIYKAVISRKQSSIQEYAVHQLKPVTEPMFDILMADAMEFFNE